MVMTQRVPTRGRGYSGLDSTKPTQLQEGDPPTLGGTAPGGTVAFQAGIHDLDAAQALAQGHPKSKQVPLHSLFDRANVIGGFGSTKGA